MDRFGNWSLESNNNVIISYDVVASGRVLWTEGINFHRLVKILETINEITRKCEVFSCSHVKSLVLYEICIRMIDLAHLRTSPFESRVPNCEHLMNFQGTEGFTSFRHEYTVSNCFCFQYNRCWLRGSCMRSHAADERRRREGEMSKHQPDPRA